MRSIKKISVAIALLVMGTAQLQAAPQDEGSWSALADWPMIALHAVLTPQGNVMTFGFQGNNEGVYIYDVWNPEQGLSANSHKTLPNTLGTDTFCSAAILMPDTGNILISGGDSGPATGDRLNGINDVAVYYSQSNALSRGASMSFARWYPTSTVLPNGEILLVGGYDESKRNVATPEVYSPSTNTWRSLFGISTAAHNFYYPRQWVAPNGKVFGIEGGKKMYYLDALGETLESVGTLSHSGGIITSSAVMYQPGKILLVGGAFNGVDNAATVIDINGDSPSVRSVNPGSATGRAWGDTVVLPTGDVMIVGGSGGNNTTSDMSFAPEIWNPASERWSQMATSETPRLYHSTALLLKDGTILVAGGGLFNGRPFRNNNAEVFSPPYLYDSSGQLASRPKITSAPSEAAYGINIDVGHAAGNEITRATLIKTGAVTHSNNMEQRFIELNFEDTNSGVKVALPISANIAPPGYYLLHLLDNKGVPSKAHTIRISGAAQQTAAPVANPDSVNVSGSSSVTINALANDTGSGLTLNAPNAWSLKGGNVALSDNKITYKPKAGYNGQDKIWYSMEDSQGRSSFGEVTITISGNSGTVDVYPVAKADNVNVSGSGSVTINALANDTGSGLTINAPNVWSLRGGNVALSNNKLTYKSKTGYNGVDKIWYSIQDNQGRSSFGEITITVSGNNLPTDVYPAATNDTVSISGGGSITIDALANDIGSGLTLDTPNAWSLNGGNVALVNNKLTYKPKADYNGTDKIWYTFKDNQNRGNSGEITIIVSGNAQTASVYPTASQDNVTARSGRNTTFDVLANDTGSGLTLSAPNAWSLKGGSVSLVNNQLVYQPKAGFTGSDNIWYVFSDSQGRSNTGQVNITVTN